MSTVVIILSCVLAIVSISVVAWFMKPKKKIINTSGLQRSPLPIFTQSYTIVTKPKKKYEKYSATTNNQPIKSQNTTQILHIPNSITSKNWQGPFPNGNLNAYKSQVISRIIPQVTPQITQQVKMKSHTIPNSSNRKLSSQQVKSYRPPVPSRINRPILN